MLFTVMQTPSPVPRKAANHPARASRDVQSQATSNKTPTAPPQASVNANAAPKNENPANAVRAEDTQKPIRVGELPSVSVTKDWTDRAYWVFSGLLVIVGGLQAWLLYGTLRAINRQADIMQRQTVATETAAIAAKANAEAAKANADAAKENVEIFINKERARITVEIDKLNLVVASDRFSLFEVDYKVFSYGPTLAFISDSRATVNIATSAEPPAGESFVPMSLRSVVSPTIEGIKKSAICFDMTRLEQTDIDSINERRSFVHFHGFIKYRDVFQRERETRFRYLWRVTDRTNLDGTPFGYWTKCGPPSDNCET